jgi:hypothetical protein
VVTSLIVAALAALLPAGFRERQRAEWLGDLTQLDGRARRRYLLTATLTLPSLLLVARRSPSSPYGGWAVTLPRRSRGYALVTAFAITAALFGAAVAGRLGWDPPPPLLSEAASQALKETVFPGRTVTGRPEAPAFAQTGDGDWTAGGALFEVPSVPAGRDLSTDAVTARDRLAAAGWTIDNDVRTDLMPDNGATDTGWSFTAHTGGLVLEFGAWRYPDRTSSQYYVRRTTFPRAPALPLLAAALVSGLAACALYRRIGDRRGRAAIRASAPTVLLFAVAPTVLLLVAREFAGPLADETWPPAWYLLFVAGGEHPWVYAALTTVFAVWVALLPTIHAPLEAPRWEYRET